MYIAIPSTIVMLILLALSLIGLDGAGSDMETHTHFGSDTDVDGDHGFPIFTIKNLITFLTMFGWVGMLCLSYGQSSTISILISTISGIFFVILMNLLFIMMYKLSHSNVISFDEAIGKEVIVYSRITKDIPGQITVMINSSLQTVSASSNDKTFQTGDTVKIVSVTNIGFIVDSI